MSKREVDRSARALIRAGNRNVTAMHELHIERAANESIARTASIRTAAAAFVALQLAMNRHAIAIRDDIASHRRRS